LFPEQGIALPIAWDELDGGAARPDPVDVKSIAPRLRGYRDPWSGFDDARAPIASR